MSLHSFDKIQDAFFFKLLGLSCCCCIICLVLWSEYFGVCVQNHRLNFFVPGPVRGCMLIAHFHSTEDIVICLSHLLLLLSFWCTFNSEQALTWCFNLMSTFKKWCAGKGGLQLVNWVGCSTVVITNSIWRVWSY